MIARARRLAAAAFEDLSGFSGSDPDFAHTVLDAWYEHEQHEPTSAGVDYFRRQAAFQLLLGLTCLPSRQPTTLDLRESGDPARPDATEPVEPLAPTDPSDAEAAPPEDATPVHGVTRAGRTETAAKLSRRERRRRG